MSLTLNISNDIKTGFEKLKKSKTPNHALVLKVIEKELSVELEEELEEGCVLEDVAKKFPNDAPRFIIVMPERVHPDGRKSYPIVLISYCPAGLPPETNIIYSNARAQVQALFQLQYVWNVNKKYKIDDEELLDKLATNKW